MNVAATIFGRLAAAAILSITFATAAEAHVTFVSSQAAFSALGTITQNTNFDAYPTDGTFSYPGSMFMVGDLTFAEGGQNAIGGTGGDVFGFVRNLLFDDYYEGTTIQIGGTHDLFALDAGSIWDTFAEKFAVTTNVSSYQFVENVSNARLGLSFIGIQASAGEYFTSVEVSAFNATGMTDIQLAQAVPEPGTHMLMLAGIGVMAFVTRRRCS